MAPTAARGAQAKHSSSRGRPVVSSAAERAAGRLRGTLKGKKRQHDFARDGSIAPIDSATTLTMHPRVQAGLHPLDCD